MLHPVDTSKPNQARELHNQVLAAMETGNTSRARERMAVLRDQAPERYSAVRLEVLRDYGVAL